MLDFLRISTKVVRGRTEVYPSFVVGRSEDLMIRGGDFYAVWVEDRGFWSTDENDVIKLVDIELDSYVAAHKDDFEGRPKICHMWDSETGIIDRWHKYCQSQQRDNYHMLDESLIFLNQEVSKKDYASKRLPYPLSTGPCPNWDKLIGTLYSDAERHKIEWAIGSIVSGDSKSIQKFMVLYGAAGTGKSTILNIVQKLFDGYYSVFDARALGSSSNSFALEAFKSNPLVAIQHDGDLSHIEDNTRLNSLVSHELMTVNEKFKSTYTNRFKSFLFMGTNKPVKITDGKSGLLRRLIDVTPSGNKLTMKEYRAVTKSIDFELGAIANHCLGVYMEDPGYYDDYIPVSMMGASNDFYNFVVEFYGRFKKAKNIDLDTAWKWYKSYCEDAKVPYPLSKMKFKEELKNYFEDYSQTNGKRVFSDFKTYILEVSEEPEQVNDFNSWIDLHEQHSVFDDICRDCIAQEASESGTPNRKWENVTTTLADINTHKLHYVRVPQNHIVIDFDLKDSDGNKSLALNMKAAASWPPTYTEVSQGGNGLHLHYIYPGDPSKLSRIFEPDIEIKVFNGKSSLRRRLSLCNDLAITIITAMLPLKEEKTLINWDGVKNEKMLRTMIKRNLNKEYHANTRPSVDYIYKILNDAKASGLNYDVTDLRNEIYAFAAGSTHQSEYCIKKVGEMIFASDEPSPDGSTIEPYSDDSPIVFYDVEVFPNLFLVNWKFAGEGNHVVRMINPKPNEIEELLHYRLVGFNNRRYDNHMIYACLLGYSNEQLFNLSSRLVNNDTKDAGIREAWNISYTDVYDYNTKKQSLKKWEIDLGIHHQELGLPWDQPVPEELWEEVAEYCDNDVIATEAVFNATQSDFAARQIQVEIVKRLHGVSNVTLNDTTNSLSAKIIFGNNKNPQSEFNWRDLSKPVSWDQYDEYREKFGPDYIFRVFDENGLPTYEIYNPDHVLPAGYSILPFFPKYRYERGISKWYEDFDKDVWYNVGAGGRVYSEPGMYVNVWDGDVASMHPHSAIYECLFGPKYTKIFKEIVDARVAIKRWSKAVKNNDDKEASFYYEKASTLLGGALAPYITVELADGLAQALKIVINAVYGLTSANYDNTFKDPNNIDNIVAKRGALFITLLKEEVEKRGFKVCHIKTDSIKIPNATQEIKDFVIRFGLEYGYQFETEADFERFCIVNDAVYIARDTDHEWHATGLQFSVPYVYKTLFTKQPIEFSDMCEAKSVKTSIYIDMNEKLDDVSDYEKELKKLVKANDNPERQEELKRLIENGHDYHYIGRIGLFCPIKDGCGGGILVRENNGKYDAVTGTKGFRWLEAERISELPERMDLIDRRYYDILVDNAIDTINQFGDFEWFASDDTTAPWFGSKIEEELPWYTDDQLFDKR